MKTRLLITTLAAFGLAVSASAQTIYNYWSFNDGDASTTAVSAGSLWATNVPTIAASFTGEGTFSFDSANAEIPQPFTAFNGTDYNRVNDSLFTLDNRNGIISAGTVTMTAPTTTLSLNMTNLEDLTLRMDVRPSELVGGDTALAASSIDYSLNSGSNWFATGSSISGLTVNDPNVVSLDFSSLAAIEGQSNVQVRIVWNDLTANDTNNGLAKLEYDNVQISAAVIPEPSSLALLAGALGLSLVMLRRRRA